MALGTVIEHELPLIVRLTVCALGAVEGGRIRRPGDPVAAWFVRNRPAIVPDEASGAALSTVRARTALIDQLVEDEVRRARQAEERLCLWVIGGGLDARWSRMSDVFAGTVVEYREVEDPRILTFKDRVLRESPFAEPWSRVQQRPKPLEGWTARPRSGARPLVLLEGLAGRMSPNALGRLLGRIHYEVPDATILLGLPGRPRAEGDHWSAFRLHALGFVVDEDTNLAPRGQLVEPGGEEICPGMYPLRVLRMHARPLGTAPPPPARR